MGNEEEPLWNNEWLKPALTKGLPVVSVVNKETLKKAAPVIEFRERRAYLDNGSVVVGRFQL